MPGAVGSPFPTPVSITAPVPGNHDTNNGTAGHWRCGGERRLAAAVLTTAIDDLARYRESTSTSGRTAYHQARAWIASDDLHWPYSFVNICDALGLEATRVRKAVSRRRGAIRLSDD